MSLVPSQHEFLRRLTASGGERELRGAKDVLLARALIKEGYIKRKDGVHARGPLQAGDTIELTDFGQRYMNSERWSKFCRS